MCFTCLFVQVRDSVGLVEGALVTELLSAASWQGGAALVEREANRVRATACMHRGVGMGMHASRLSVGGKTEARGMGPCETLRLLALQALNMCL